jgi:hypothetical protein
MPPSSYSYSSSLSSSVSSTRPLLLAAAALLATAARAHSAYRSYLPNGFAPSSTSYGHIDGTKYGNSNLNSFGSDLNAAGLSWSRTLCTRDSDGDGQSNGLELGDPCCTWTSGPPQFTSQLGDPGHASVRSSRNCSAIACANGVNACVPASTGGARAGAALSLVAAILAAAAAAQVALA